MNEAGCILELGSCCLCINVGEVPTTTACTACLPAEATLPATAGAWHSSAGSSVPENPDQVGQRTEYN